MLQMLNIAASWMKIFSIADLRASFVLASVGVHQRHANFRKHSKFIPTLTRCGQVTV